MFFDLAVRDIEIAIGAYALARLTEVRESAAVPAGSRGAPEATSSPTRPAEAKSHSPIETEEKENRDEEESCA